VEGCRPVSRGFELELVTWAVLYVIRE